LVLRCVRRLHTDFQCSMACTFIVLLTSLAAFVLRSAAEHGVSLPTLTERRMISCELPPRICVPDGNVVKIRAYTDGVERYRCDGESWEWTGLYAELSLDGVVFGRHFLGARNRVVWQWNDGSSLEGSILDILGTDLAPDRFHDIPWLLWEPTSHGGEGVLSNVTFIQRVDTAGGAPTALDDCEESRAGEDGTVRFTATHIFHVPVEGENDERVR